MAQLIALGNSGTMDIGSRIRAIRRGKNLTQVELGRRIGVSSQAVNNWEHGRDVPSRENLLRAARSLGVPLGDLLQPPLLSEQNANGTVKPSYPLGPGGRTVPVVPHESAQVADKEAVATSSIFISFETGPNAFAVAIWDESNAPDMPAGTYVVIDPDKEAFPGSWVLAMWGTRVVGGTLTYETTASGTIAIVKPLNGNWPSWREDMVPSFDIIGVKTETHLRG